MISVVITAKDAETTLLEAVESCLAQTYSNFELLLIDNGSKDRTRELMASLQDPRVKVFSCEGSHVDAHCLGIRESRGELVARVDADDVCLPQRFERQMAMMENDPSLDACTCCVRIATRGREIGDGFLKYADWLNGLVEPEDIAWERFIESPVVHPASMVRRSALEMIGGYKEVVWAEDYDLWLRFLEAGLKVGMVPECLFEWYDSDTRLTRSNDRYSHDNFLKAKAHYLARLGGVFEICGAGPIGKRIGRLLLDEGVELRAFYELNPKRIGEKIAGVPVLDQAEMRRREDIVLLGAVGLDGARDFIRELAAAEGYQEGVDFWCVA